MGRTRVHSTELPKCLYFERRGYRYRMAVNGERQSIPLGRNRAAAVVHAARLNKMRRQERLESFQAFRHVLGALRAQIFERDNFKCAYCGGTSDLGIDHIIPHGAGGSSLPFNVVTACADCNSLKGAGDPRDFILALIDAGPKILDAVISRKTP